MTCSVLIAKVASPGLSAPIQSDAARLSVCRPTSSFRVHSVAPAGIGNWDCTDRSAGQLLGLLTRDNLTEYLMIQGALKAARNGGQVSPFVRKLSDLSPLHQDEGHPQLVFLVLKDSETVKAGFRAGSDP